MDESDHTQHRIPRRSSATPDTVAPRQTPSGNALSSTHTRRHTKDDDDVSSGSAMKPLVRRLDRAPLTVASPLIRHYRIALSDGTQLHVTERQLADLPQNYQNGTPHDVPGSSS